MRVPVLDLQVNRPSRGSLAWYGGVGAMATIGLVEWPLAAILVTGHAVAESSRSSTVSEAAEGASDAAG